MSGSRVISTRHLDVTHAQNSHARMYMEVRVGNHWQASEENIAQIVSQAHSRCVCGGSFTHVVRSLGCPYATKSPIANRLSLRNADHVSPISLPRSSIQPHHRQRRRVYVNIIANTTNIIIPRVFDNMLLNIYTGLKCYSTKIISLLLLFQSNNIKSNSLHHSLLI